MAEDDYRPSWVSDFPCPRCGQLMRRRGSFTCEVYSVFHVWCGKCGTHEEIVKSHMEDLEEVPVENPADSKIARWVKPPKAAPGGKWTPGKNRARRRK